MRCVKSIFMKFFVSDEYKGHSLLEGARQADLARVKKYISLEIVNFKHPYTNDTALVSIVLIVLAYMGTSAQVRIPSEACEKVACE